MNIPSGWSRIDYILMLVDQSQLFPRNISPGSVASERNGSVNFGDLSSLRPVNVPPPNHMPENIRCSWPTRKLWYGSITRWWSFLVDLPGLTPVFDGVSPVVWCGAPLSIFVALGQYLRTSDGDIQVSTENLHNMISRIKDISVRTVPALEYCIDMECRTRKLATLDRFISRFGNQDSAVDLL